MSEQKPVDLNAIRAEFSEDELEEMRAMSPEELIDLLVRCRRIWYSYMDDLEQAHVDDMNSCYKALSDQDQAISAQLARWEADWEARLGQHSKRSKEWLAELQEECGAWQASLKQLSEKLSSLRKR